MVLTLVFTAQMSYDFIRAELSDGRSSAQVHATQELLIALARVSLAQSAFAQVHSHALLTFHMQAQPASSSISLFAVSNLACVLARGFLLYRISLAGASKGDPFFRPGER